MASWQPLLFQARSSVQFPRILQGQAHMSTSPKSMPQSLARLRPHLQRTRRANLSSRSLALAQHRQLPPVLQITRYPLLAPWCYAASLESRKCKPLPRSSLLILRLQLHHTFHTPLPRMKSYNLLLSCAERTAGRTRRTKWS